MVSQGKPTPRRIAIIGAGAAGLVSAKSCTELGHHVIVFESTDCVGGTWVLREDKPGAKIHSSMYQNLHTNLPKQVMGYSDLAIEGPPGTPQFPHHTVIREYLDAYAAKHDLLRLVRLRTPVVRVRRVAGDSVHVPDGQAGDPSGLFDGRRWEVTVRNGDSDDAPTETLLFDAVLVCNGHYSKPYIPNYRRSDRAPGTQIVHSHWYRTPSQYAGKTMVVIGGGSSGCDIARELASVCTKVYLFVADYDRMHTQTVLELPNVVRMGKFEGFDDNGCAVDNAGAAVSADAVIFCTGYYYDFPFLKGTPHDHTAHTNGAYVDHLYRHMIDIDEPTLAYIGLPASIVPFPLFEYQANWVARVYAGLIALPSEPAMREELEEHRQRVAAEGKGKGAFHILGFDQFAYNDMLADECNQIAALPRVPNVSPEAVNLYRYARELRKSALGY